MFYTIANLLHVFILHTVYDVRSYLVCWWVTLIETAESDSLFWHEIRACLTDLHQNEVTRGSRDSNLHYLPRLSHLGVGWANDPTAVAAISMRWWSHGGHSHLAVLRYLLGVQKSGHSKPFVTYIQIIKDIKDRVKQRSYRHIMYDLLLRVWQLPDIIIWNNGCFQQQ